MSSLTNFLCLILNKSCGRFPISYLAGAEVLEFDGHPAADGGQQQGALHVWALRDQLLYLLPRRARATWHNRWLVTPPNQRSASSPFSPGRLRSSRKRRLESPLHTNTGSGDKHQMQRALHHLPGTGDRKVDRPEPRASPRTRAGYTASERETAKRAGTAARKQGYNV